MDEQLRVILIIIVSVSIFGLIVFVFVRSYLKNKIDYLVKVEKHKKLDMLASNLTFQYQDQIYQQLYA